MKKLVCSFLASALFFAVSSALAGGEIGGYYDAEMAKGGSVRKIKPIRSACQRGPFVMYPGSLKGNIDRLATDHCWPVVKWNVETDFEWSGAPRGTVIHAGSLQDALRKILEKYPVQAQFYLGNHVLAIEPRTLKNDINS